MKIAGIVLIILQIIAIISAVAGGRNPFSGNLLEVIGYFLFGIIGVILLIAAYVRKNKQNQDNEKDDNNDKKDL